MITTKACQNFFTFILTSSGGTPVKLLRILLLLLNPKFCLLLSFRKTSSKVSIPCISISFLGDSSAKNLPLLIKPIILACLEDNHFSNFHNYIIEENMYYAILIIIQNVQRVTLIYSNT